MSPHRERPTLVGKSGTKAAGQQKRKAAHGAGRQQQARPGGSGGDGKKPRRTAGAQVVGMGGMMNLA